MKPSPGAITTAEIETQPQCWTRAVEVAGTHSAALPRHGERVLVIGCGTSYYIARAYAWLREQAGHGETDAAVASELPTRLRPYDRIMALSRSGTSVEVIDALAQLPAGVPRTAVIGVVDTPVAAAATRVVPLKFADEQSVVQTRFATTALALFRASLGEDLTAVIAEAKEALASDLPPTPERQLVILGHDWSTAIGEEAALKCREAAAVWAETYPRGEYRHGPIAVADATTLVWSLAPLAGVQRQAVLDTGARLEVSTRDPMAELVRLHRFAVRWATERGRDADRPTNLSRSVTDV
ncbi:SIS domain-containing protein [Rhizomonospora bruguierae]|uniref:SIS domain-containing protein n=1 Tax=Rhizomonospora bruguierae TaxID=1581705 RepID=UPI0020C02ADF|nr:sugar isomerase [Micromonospora sp. NBRC 107566]